MNIFEMAIQKAENWNIQCVIIKRSLLTISYSQNCKVLRIIINKDSFRGDADMK